MLGSNHSGALSEGDVASADVTWPVSQLTVPEASAAGIGMLQ